jgi:hypothetical protein
MESVTQGTQEVHGQAEAAVSAIAGVIQVDPEKIEGYLDQKVRESVEQTLNTLLEEEADRACGAKRYQRCEQRADTRAGHYKRKLLTKDGEVELEVPRLRKLPLETAIIERYRRRESSVEEALIEDSKCLERWSKGGFGNRVIPAFGDANAGML